MDRWVGAAAICINKDHEVLMVLQGKPEEQKTWSVPSGGLEKDETMVECCLRELREETGYLGKMKQPTPIWKKQNINQNVSIEVNYYVIEIIGGKMSIEDPDQLIQAIAWISKDKLQQIILSFPEDKSFLVKLLSK